MDKITDKKISISGALLSFFVFLLPFVTLPGLFYGSVNAKSFFIQSIAYIFVLIYLWRVLKNKISVTVRKQYLILSILLVWVLYVVASFFGVFPERSFFSDILRFTGVSFFTHILILSFVLGQMLSSKDWSLVRKSIGISGVFFSTILFFNESGNGGLTFGNSTFAGAYVFLSLMILLIEIIRSDKKTKSKFILWVLFVLGCFSPLFINLKAVFSGIVFSNPVTLLGSARASSVTLILALVFLLGQYFIRRVFEKDLKNKIFKGWCTVWLVALSFGIGSLFVSQSFVQNKYIETSSSARIIVWEGSMKAIAEKPFLGWGPENFSMAFQGYFNNDSFSSKNFSEIWFDRAHNIFIDTLIDVGFVGFFAIVLAIFVFLRVVLIAYKNELIGFTETSILFTIVFGHILQLQTSFDTIGSYALIALLVAYVISLEKRVFQDSQDTKYTKIFVVVFCIIFMLFSPYLLINEFRRQVALSNIFKTVDNDKQLRNINIALSKTSDFESLRFSSASLIKGGLVAIAQSKGNAEIVKIISNQLSVYEGYYKKYLAKNPNDYRAQVNYGYLLLVKTSLGENRLVDASNIIRDSKQLSPDNILSDGLDIVVDVYSGKIVEARKKADMLVATYPDLRFATDILSYVKKQQASWPEVTVIKLENI